MGDPTRRSSSPGSPGITGAIKDAISAVADAVAPRSVVQAPARRKAQEDDATSDQHSDDYLARARAGQSTDAANQ